jgi:hypothetical protein
MRSYADYRDLESASFSWHKKNITVTSFSWHKKTLPLPVYSENGFKVYYDIP